MTEEQLKDQIEAKLLADKVLDFLVRGHVDMLTCRIHIHVFICMCVDICGGGGVYGCIYMYTSSTSIDRSSQPHTTPHQTHNQASHADITWEEAKEA